MVLAAVAASVAEVDQPGCDAHFLEGPGWLCSLATIGRGPGNALTWTGTKERATGSHPHDQLGRRTDPAR